MPVAKQYWLGYRMLPMKAPLAKQDSLVSRMLPIAAPIAKLAGGLAGGWAGAGPGWLLQTA